MPERRQSDILYTQQTSAHDPIVRAAAAYIKHARCAGLFVIGMPKAARTDVQRMASYSRLEKAGLVFKAPAGGFTRAQPKAGAPQAMPAQQQPAKPTTSRPMVGFQSTPMPGLVPKPMPVQRPPVQQQPMPVQRPPMQQQQQPKPVQRPMQMQMPGLPMQRPMAMPGLLPMAPLMPAPCVPGIPASANEPRGTPSQMNPSSQPCYGGGIGRSCL